MDSPATRRRRPALWSALVACGLLAAPVPAAATNTRSRVEVGVLGAARVAGAEEGAVDEQASLRARVMRDEKGFHAHSGWRAPRQAEAPEREALAPAAEALLSVEAKLEEAVVGALGQSPSPASSSGNSTDFNSSFNSTQDVKVVGLGAFLAVTSLLMFCACCAPIACCCGCVYFMYYLYRRDNARQQALLKPNVPANFAQGTAGAKAAARPAAATAKAKAAVGRGAGAGFTAAAAAPAAASPAAAAPAAAPATAGGAAAAAGTASMAVGPVASMRAKGGQKGAAGAAPADATASLAVGAAASLRPKGGKKGGAGGPEASLAVGAAASIRGKGAAKGAAAGAAGAPEPAAGGGKPDPNALWAEFDADGSGQLEESEVEKMLRVLFEREHPGETLSKEVLRNAAEVLDKDQSGKITKVEFIEMYDDFFEILYATPGEGGPRDMQPNQKIVLFVDGLKGSGMPSVNTFGGCDPLLEVRVVKGDPASLERFGVDEKAAPGTFAQTECKQGELNPKWTGRLEVGHCVNKLDTYVQIIVFDWNVTTNTALVERALPLGTALAGLKYHHSNEMEKVAHELTLSDMINPGATELKGAKIQCNMFYAELLRYKLTIVKASRVPKMKTFGTADAYIEARVVRGDPKKMEFSYAPGDNVIWSGKSKVVANSMDPRWDETLEFEVAGDPDYRLVLILWDSNSPMSDTAICQTVLELKEIAALEPGSAPVQHSLKFSRLPKVDPVAEFKKTTLKLTIGQSLVFESE